MTAQPGDIRHQDLLVVMVPGVGMVGGDFETGSFTGPVADSEPDAYPNSSVATRRPQSIATAHRNVGAGRIGPPTGSMGCQAIFRCFRSRPDPVGRLGPSVPVRPAKRRSLAPGAWAYTAVSIERGPTGARSALQA
jgi:hypothetical protein